MVISGLSVSYTSANYAAFRNDTGENTNENAEDQDIQETQATPLNLGMSVGERNNKSGKSDVIDRLNEQKTNIQQNISNAYSRKDASPAAIKARVKELNKQLFDLDNQIMKAEARSHKQAQNAHKVTDINKYEQAVICDISNGLRGVNSLTTAAKNANGQSGVASAELKTDLQRSSVTKQYIQDKSLKRETITTELSAHKLEANADREIQITGIGELVGDKVKDIEDEEKQANKILSGQDTDKDDQHHKTGIARPQLHSYTAQLSYGKTAQGSQVNIAV